MKKKEKPILFNPEMVKAVLSGRKTQTRRVVKPQPEVSDKGHLIGAWLQRPLDGLLLPKIEDIIIHCPYGQVGDRLWVRERFCIGEIVAGDSLPEEEDPIYIEQCKGSKDAIPYEYAVSQGIGIEDVKWKPSIFMRREYSRINLEITNIRVERLQDITEDDARAEGTSNDDDPYWIPSYNDPDSGGNPSYVNSFNFLWNSINEQRGYSFESNPYVWVVKFRRV